MTISLSDDGQRRISTLFLYGMAICIFFYIFTSARFLSSGDAKHFLFVSQAILEQGTIKLDGQLIDPRHYGVTEYNGHLYNFYPLGPSLVALPIVYAAKFFGYAVATHNDFLQNITSSLLCALTFIVLVKTANFYLKRYESLYAALLFFLGTSLTSTNGAAYFSSTSASFFSCLALLYFVKSIHEQKKALAIFLMAFYAYAAFLCRQQLFIFVVFLVCSYFFIDKKSTLKICIYLSFFTMAYCIFNFIEYGELFIPYAGTNYRGIYFFSSLMGLLISPNRGLFIFSPILLIPCVLLLFCRNVDKGMLVLTAAYPVAYLCFVAAYTSWHGGWSFGPRLLTDMLPAVFLLLCVVWTRFRGQKLLLAYTILGVISAYIHYEGLHCLKTVEWSAFYGPHANENHDPRLFFDWKNMQILARFHNFPIEKKSYADSIDIQLSGLSPIKTDGVWWSDADINRDIMLHLSKPLQGTFILNLQMKANHPQTVTVTAGTRTFSFKTKGARSVHYPLTINAVPSVDTIVLTPSNPHRPKVFGPPSDSRKLGIGIEKIWISPQ